MSSLRPVSGTTPEVVEALRDWLAGPGEPEPLVIATSGSTGAPKRVALTRRAVLASAAATTQRLGAEGRWLLALPASYVAGLMVVVRSLVAGHEPAPVDGSFAGLVRGGSGPAFTSLVPTQLLRLLDDPAETEALAGLHTVLLGGGPIEPALRARAEAAGIHVVATYGASETSGGCVYDGLPLAGVRVRVGAGGRLAIAGPMLFDGYDGDPALTAETLVDGWFLTSDAGRLDEDGRLRILGRLDDIVVSGGVNVPAAAVAVRLREHPGVSAAEVVGVADPEWGQRVVAVVVGTLTEAEARAWVAEVHPRAWAPRQVVRVAALPLLDTGKVDRLRLQELA